MQLLFNIEDVFDISGRGCIVVPGIPYSLGLNVKVGAPVLIVSPEGDRLHTTIASFERFHRRAEGLTHAAFAVSRDVKKASLKVGSSVYLLGEGDA